MEFPEDKRKELVEAHDYANWVGLTKTDMLGLFKDMKIRVKFWPHYHNKDGGTYTASASIDRGRINLEQHEWKHAGDPVSLVTDVVWRLTEQIKELKEYCYEQGEGKKAE